MVWMHSRQLENDVVSSLSYNRLTWLQGPSGCGKSTLCAKILKNFPHHDISGDLYGNKVQLIKFLNNIDPSKVLVIDGMARDSNKWSLISEIIQNYSNKFLFLTEYENILGTVDMHTIIMKAPSKTKMINYGIKKIGEKETLEIYQKFSKNFRNFLNAVDCFKRFDVRVSSHDEFFDSNRNVKDLLCKGGTGYQRFIGNGIEEHGHVIDMVASNYTAKTIEDSARIMDSISLSDSYDSQMYMGNWEFLPYLTLHGCVIPSKISGNALKPAQIHPGYVWTKYYNQCMRKKLISAVTTRNPTMKSMGAEFLIYLCSMLQSMDFDESIALLREYRVQSCDLDLMNHLVKTKLKGKKLNILKRALKNDRREASSHQNH